MVFSRFLPSIVSTAATCPAAAPVPGSWVVPGWSTNHPFPGHQVIHEENTSQWWTNNQSLLIEWMCGCFFIGYSLKMLFVLILIFIIFVIIIYVLGMFRFIYIDLSESIWTSWISGFSHDAFCRNIHWRMKNILNDYIKGTNEHVSSPPSWDMSG